MPTSVHRHLKRLTHLRLLETLRDFVGMYLNPSDSALVLCVVEKILCQAPERLPPLPSLDLDFVEGVTAPRCTASAGRLRRC